MKNPVRTFMILLTAMFWAVGGELGLADFPTPEASEAPANGIAWPFFAFDNGVGRDEGWAPERQAKLTSQLGYAGIGYSGVDDLDARFAACDRQGQRIFSFYEAFRVGQSTPVTPAVSQSLPKLQGKGAIVWIHVDGTVPEEEAVASFRQFADEAGRYGVRVAIYPHANNYVETGRHALKLAQAVGRKNFGMSINVCHELKAGRGSDLVDLVKDSIDHLFLVSINGADRVAEPQRERDWSRLIRPLDEGDFDLQPMLGQLYASGYKGPIGLQCYQVKGDTDELLRRSIRAWHELVAQVVNGSPTK